MKQQYITLSLILLMSIFGTKTFAYDIAVANEDGVTIYYNWIYRDNRQELSVCYKNDPYYGGDNSKVYTGNVVIPKSVEYKGVAYNVTIINSQAFYNCSDLNSVTIPNSVTSIGDKAFENCSGLTSVTIPNSVTSIGKEAFYGTGWYNNQPDGLVYAGKVLYKYKGSMPKDTKITIEDGTLGIAADAFSGCNNLVSVIIPSSVIFISYNAFSGCSTEFVVKVLVTNLSDFCDNKIIGLVKDVIGKPVTLIDIANNEIEEYIIPDGVTSIGNYAFSNCTGLISVTIPCSVTSIGKESFSNCSSLTFVNCLCCPTSLGKDIFWGCPNLQEVIFDSERIVSLFSGITSITKIKMTSKVTSIDSKAFYNCSGLTSVTIPNNVTSIGSEAFFGCSRLTSVIIGSGVTSIGYNALNSNIKKTIWLTNTPPTGSNNVNSSLNSAAL